MSDALKHECGIAMVRLLKPLQFYKDKYGSAFYGLNKMYLLMEKQHNRGQDGAGLASIKKIVSTKIPGGRGGGSVPSITVPTGGPPVDPNAAIAGSAQGQDQNNQITLGEQQGSGGANVIRAYVVSDEMTTQQERDKKINDLARL